MMAFIFTAMVIISVLSALFSGRMEQVSAAAMTECGNAVKLVLSLMGVMCMWSGVMKVAERAGLTERFGRLFAPVLRLLFRDIDPNGPAACAITMNVAANLLGLGNAATPLGITAMCELEKLNRENGTASDAMVTFVVMNTASLQLIPTTTAAMRLQAGSLAPFEILPAVWLASLASILCALLMTRLLGRKKKKHVARQAMGEVG